MRFIYHPAFLQHETGAHPENKNRLLSLEYLPETMLEDGEKYLALVHSEKHIAHVKDTCSQSLPLDVDTLTSPGSFTAAIHAVSAAILASQTNGFALVRPPGHHAFASHGSGFCLFN